jgi:hypothetical protein
MKQTQRKHQGTDARTPQFEASPWTPRELVLEEPIRAAAATPIALEQNEHVIDALLDGDSIRRER